MTDQKITSFLTIARLGSYTRAAAALNLTQPALSHHVRLLEEYYGCKLLSYDNRVLALTPAGMLIRDHFQTVLAGEKQLLEKLKHLEDQKRDIRFGATLTIGEFTMAPVMGDLFEAFPKDRPSMLVDNTKNILSMLKEGELSFALVEGLISKDEFEAKLLKTCDFILVVSPEHPLSGEKEVHLSDLLKEVLIIREKGSGSREILEKGLLEKNRSLESFRDIMEMGNVNVIKRMVEKNLGISLMYRDAALTELKKGSLVEVRIIDLLMEREFNFVELRMPAGESQNQVYYEFFRNEMQRPRR